MYLLHPAQEVIWCFFLFTACWACWICVKLHDVRCLLSVVWSVFSLTVHLTWEFWRQMALLQQQHKCKQTWSGTFWCSRDLQERRHRIEWILLCIFDGQLSDIFDVSSYQIFTLPPDCLSSLFVNRYRVMDNWGWYLYIVSISVSKDLYAIATVLDLSSDQVSAINYNVCSEVRVLKKATVRHISMSWLRCEWFHIYMLMKVCACVLLM